MFRPLAAPAVEEIEQPGADGEIVDGAIAEMVGAGLRARQRHALVAGRGPAAHPGVGDLGRYLDAAGRRPVAERLALEEIALRQEVCAGRQVETLAVPL